MNNVVFLIFRRMRRPLISLVLVYAVAILGLVLIPGRDAQGHPWHMDFFHAFYFVSFMATTIGFGELPYEFTDGQRMWVIVSIYITVVVWIYAIGNVLTLLQDATFRQAMTEQRFSRRIKAMREEFYLVCGYGETGSALVNTLTERNQHAVVVDIDEERVSLLGVENLRQFVPGLCGDAARPIHLLEAGLKHPLCAGVVALTNQNEVNLKIAITSKLLHPEVRVICRADSHDIEANMASFGTDYIIDPFDTFARHLATALQSPGLYLLHDWLTSLSHSELTEPVYPPAQGLWVLCGYGRFGKAVLKRLRAEGLEVVVIEADPALTGISPDDCVVGVGTEPETLQQAQIERAAGLVAGTDNDANNLSIIMTARQLNAGLFVVARQNLMDNQSIFEAVQANMVMHPSSIIANKIQVLLATPMLFEFISLAQYQDEGWACELVSRIAAITSTTTPEIWEVSIEEEQALAVSRCLAEGQPVRLHHLLADPRERENRLPSIALMIESNNARQILPAAETVLHIGDRLLFCGHYAARSKMEWTLQNQHALAYIMTGGSRPQGKVWRTLERLMSRHGA